MEAFAQLFAADNQRWSVVASGSGVLLTILMGGLVAYLQIRWRNKSAEADTHLQDLSKSIAVLSGRIDALEFTLAHPTPTGKFPKPPACGPQEERPADA